MSIYGFPCFVYHFFFLQYVSNVTNLTNYLSVTVKTLEGHPDAGQNTFTTMYDPKTSTMTWQTNNISRSNDLLHRG
jgi:hypothetical protein